MLRIRVLASFDLAVEEATHEFAVSDIRRAAAFSLAVGAAFERICENPGLGHPIVGGMSAHALDGFAYAVIYEVTEREICFLYLAVI